MAEAVIPKKKKGTEERRSKWAQWLSSSGTLSLGFGSTNEVEVTAQEYDDLKSKPTEDRIKFYDNKFAPPPPAPIEEPPKPAEVVAAVETPVVAETPAEVTPVVAEVQPV